MAMWQLSGELVLWITHLSGPLHGRIAWRLLPIFTGMLFAQGRKTVATWLRGGGLGRGFGAYYYFLGGLRRFAPVVSSMLMLRAVRLPRTGTQLILCLDAKGALPYTTTAGGP